MIRTSVIPSSAEVDDITISKNVNGKIELKDNGTWLGVPKILEQYSGTGFDCTGNETDEHELTAYTAEQIKDATYLIIDLLVATKAQEANGLGRNGRCYLTIQTKYVGGAYSDSMPQKLIHETVQNESSAAEEVGTGPLIRNITWIHTLTANEKTNGVQVKIIGQTSISAGGVAILTNHNTVIKRM